MWSSGITGILEIVRPNSGQMCHSNRIPIPSLVTNIFARYYIDWAMQVMTGAACGIVLLTPALFFIGMCLYIGKMVDDLRETLAEMDGSPKISTKQITDPILFHSDLLK